MKQIGAPILAPHMIDGNCRTIQIALLGQHHVGKSTTAYLLTKVSSFDKLFAGAARPTLPKDALETTEFTRYACLDVVLQQCHRAAAHRVFLIDTPSSNERAAIYRGLLHQTRGAIEGGVLGAIVFSSTSSVDEEGANDDAVCQYLDDCAANNTHVLLLHKGTMPVSRRITNRIESFRPRNNSGSTRRPLRSKDGEDGNEAEKQQETAVKSPIRGEATIRYVVTGASFDDEEGFVEVARSFVAFVQNIHDDVEAAETAAAQYDKEVAAAQARESARIPPVGLPPPQAVQNASWNEGTHSPDAARAISVVLVGAPCSGKTTFVTALVDGFVLNEYVPSTDLEIAHSCLNLGGDRVDRLVNLTFYDGVASCRPLTHSNSSKSNANHSGARKHAMSALQHCSAALSFLDVSDPYGVERWQEAIDALPCSRPPHLGIICVKNDISSSSLFSTDALMDLAGENNAFLAFLDTRTTFANRLLTARFVAHISLMEEKTKINLERQRLIHHQEPNLIPHTEEDITKLFHRYDTGGTGFIRLQEAKVILLESQLGLFCETFEECIAYVEKTFGPLVRSHTESREKLVNKDQLGLMLCRLNKR